MHKAVLVVRFLLGALFTFLSADHLFQLGLLGEPPEMSAKATTMMTAFAESGYMLELIKGTEFTAGVLLLLGQFVPFALVILAPVTVNIALFHVYLEPSGMALGMAFTIAAMHLFLFAAYGQAFEGVMKRVRVIDRRKM